MKARPGDDHLSSNGAVLGTCGRQSFYWMSTYLVFENAQIRVLACITRPTHSGFLASSSDAALYNQRNLTPVARLPAMDT
jgi:hypothetical protein